jgi:hypothetical protein
VVLVFVGMVYTNVVGGENHLEWLNSMREDSRFRPVLSRRLANARRLLIGTFSRAPRVTG